MSTQAGLHSLVALPAKAVAAPQGRRGERARIGRDSKAVLRGLMTTITSAWGVRALLWPVAGVLLAVAVRPAPAAWVIFLFCLAGLTAQGATYVLSHRPWLVKRRPAGFVLATATAATLASMAVLIALVMAGIGLKKGAVTLDPIPATTAALLSAGLVASGYARRAHLIRLTAANDRRVDAVRPSARVLLADGPLRAGQLVERLRTIAAIPGKSADLLTDLLAACRTEADSRFTRQLPWQTAATLVQAHLDRLAIGGRLTQFRRQESLDFVRVRPETVCRLIDALGPAWPEGGVLGVRSFEHEGALVIDLAVQSLAGPSALDEAALCSAAAFDAANAALREGLLIDRVNSVGRLSIKLRVDAPSRDRTSAGFDLANAARALAAAAPAGNETQLKSGSGKVTFRSDDLVFRVQPDAAIDTRPTLVDEEFHILSRLHAVTDAVPRPFGFGCKNGVRWMAYAYEAGQPLEAWAQSPQAATGWFRIVVELGEALRRFEQAGVHHLDLNPGNVIVRQAGGVALIDFDQAIADDPRFAGADIDGVERELAKNDLQVLLDRCGWVRQVNSAAAELSNVWSMLPARRTGALDFGTEHFAGQTPVNAQWAVLGSVLARADGKTVTEWGGTCGGVIATLIATLGARVTVVADQPAIAEACRRVAAVADVSLDVVQTHPPSASDLAMVLDSDGLSADEVLDRAALAGQVIFEHRGPLAVAKAAAERRGLIWRGLAGYSPRLWPWVAVARPGVDMQWLNVRTS